MKIYKTQEKGSEFDKSDEEVCKWVDGFNERQGRMSTYWSAQVATETEGA